MPTVSAHVAVTLAAFVPQVFGVMGHGNAHLLDALDRRTGTGYTAVRHESGAVAAADAFHRAGGGLAAATTTYGAGFSNTLTALAEAVQARTPLVLVVGDEPTSGPRDWDVDQIALASAVGARTYTVGRTDAAATTAIAVEHALAYRVPVVLAVPYDVATLDAGPIPPAPALRLPAVVRPSGAFAEAALDTLAAELAGAERPLLLAGRGAVLAGAGPALGRLAAAVGALTATTALGRGLFPDTRFDLGVTGGFGADGAMRLVASADVVAVFGASLNAFTTRFGALFGPGARVTQIDVAAAATHPHVGGYLRGDAAAVADAVLRRLDDGGPRSRWRDTAPLGGALAREDAPEFATDGRLDPRAAARRLGVLLPVDRIVVSDGGHFMGWANMYWPVAAPERMIMVGTAYQAIGLGFPSAAGAALAYPPATVVLCTGDGGGLMALADLETAVRVTGGRGVTVVWNDAAYGAEVAVYGAQGLAEAPMRIPEADFAALGTAVGAQGVVVRRLADLEVLAAWAQHPPAERPHLVLDLRISGTVVSPHQHEIIAATRTG